NLLHWRSRLKVDALLLSLHGEGLDQSRPVSFYVMIRARGVGHVDRRINELNALLLQPPNRISGLIDDGPHQAGVCPPVAVLHDALVCLVFAVSDVPLPLHRALDGEGAFEEVRSPTEGTLLFKDDNPCPTFGCRERGGQTGGTGADYNYVCFHTVSCHHLPPQGNSIYLSRASLMAARPSALYGGPPIRSIPALSSGARTIRDRG